MRGTKSLLTKLGKMSTAIEKDVPQAIASEVQLRGQRADVGFASAQYDGNNDVSVSVDSGQNVWSITASGTKVLFIEYGSGLRFKHDSEFGNYGAYSAGSWSETHSRFLVEPKWIKWKDWWPLPGGGQSLGNPSANVMYETSKMLRQTIPVLSKQTFHKAVSK